MRRQSKRGLAVLLTMAMVLLAVAPVGYADFVEPQLQEHSVYEFSTEGKTTVKVNEESAGSVALKPSVEKDLGYEHVLIKVAVTEKPGSAGDPVVKATDSLGQEFDIVALGYWGTPGGFPVAADYTATTNLKLTFPASGTYKIKYQLVDLDNEQEVLTEKVTTFTVKTALEHSVYEFTTTGETAVKKNVESAGSVALKPSVEKDLGYEHVQIKISVTEKPVTGGNPVILATTLEGMEHDIVETGVWGPRDGFPITKNYNGSIALKLTFPASGTYKIKYQLVDMDNGEAVLTEKETTFTVTPVEYTITYNLDGGTNYSGAPATYTDETETIILGTPTKAGYTFGGWYAEAGFTTSVTQIVKGTTGNKVLYAKWTAVPQQEHSVYEFTTGGETAVKKNVESAGSVTLVTNTKKDLGYDHVLIKVAVTEKPGSAGDPVVLAKNYQNVEYDIIEEGTWGPPGGFPVAADYTATTELKLTFPASGFYKIKYQLVDLDNGEAVLAEKETTFNVAPVEYTITYNLDGGTNYSGAPATYSDETDTIILGTPTKAGYTFGGWYAEAGFTTPVTQIVKGTTGNKVLYAKWTAVPQQEHSVYEFTTTGETAVKKNVESAGSVTLRAKEEKDLGYDHVLIKVAVTEKPGSAGDPVVKATDSLGQEFDIVALGYWGPPGGFPVAADYTATTNLKLTFPASGTYKIKYQLVDLDNSEAVLAEKETTFTVTPAEYTIIYNLDGGTNYNGAPATYTDETETITLGTPAKEGFNFAGWYETSDFSTAAVTQIVKGTTGNKVFYAKWTQKAVLTIDSTVQNAVYDSTAKIFSLTVTPENVTGFTVKYQQSGEDVQPVAAGTYDVVVTREADATYEAFSQTIAGGLVIAKADVTLTAPEASAVAAGALLSNSTLTGGSAVRAGSETAVEGTFAWTNGTQTVAESGNFEATFTPADTANYNTAVCQVAVTAQPQENSKKISVGEQSGTLTEGVAGTVTFDVTTENIEDSEPLTAVWYNSWEGTQTATAPAGIAISVDEVSANKTTVKVTADTNTVSGNYYLKIVSQDAASQMAKLVIDINGDIVVETAPEAGAPEVSLGSGVGNAVLSDEEKDDVKAGATASVTVGVEKVTNSPDADKVEAEVPSGKKIGMYLDITVEKTIKKAGEEPVVTNVTQTNEPLRITVTIPQELRGHKSYQVVRVHGGVAKTLQDLDQNPDTVTFESDSYSTYALIYDPELLKVTFLNEGVTYHTLDNIEKGTTITLPSDPVKSGYTFKGWYTSENGRGTKLTSSTKIQNTMNVYAYWTKNYSPGPGPDHTNNGRPSSGGGTGGVVVGPPAQNGTHEAYINGYGDGTFRPENNTTRAEAAVLFARVSPGFNEYGTYSANYPDVTEDWYRNAVGFASQKGIITGDTTGNYRPADSITRAEFASMAVRYLGLTPGGGTNFADCQGHWAEGYISVLVQNGIINGYGDGSFRPDAPITRAEAVKILNRILKRTPDSSKVSAGSAFSDVQQDMWAYYEIIEATVKHVASEMH